MENNRKNDSVKQEKDKRESLKTISRRTFLKNTGIAFAVLFALGGAGTVAKGKPLLRPPGGQNEDSLLSKCLKCDRCRSICPTSAITVASTTDGIVEAGTPVMNYKNGYCDFCNKCVEYCPTGALESFDHETVKIGKAVVQEDVCIAWVTGTCTICVEKCPYGAIYLDQYNRPVVDEEKCNGCGVCEYECYAFILRSYTGGKKRGIIVVPITEQDGAKAYISPSTEGGDFA